MAVRLWFLWSLSKRHKISLINSQHNGFDKGTDSPGVPSNNTTGSE